MHWIVPLSLPPPLQFHDVKPSCLARQDAQNCRQIGAQNCVVLEHRQRFFSTIDQITPHGEVRQQARDGAAVPVSGGRLLWRQVIDLKPIVRP